MKLILFIHVYEIILYINCDLLFCFGYNYRTIGPLVDDDTVVLIEIRMVSLSMLISFMYLLYSFLLTGVWFCVYQFTAIVYFLLLTLLMPL